MRPRRTVNLPDDIWRAARLRAVSDNRTVSEVIEAAIQTAVVVGGPLVYGNGLDIDRIRYIHEWVGGTELGKAAEQALAAELDRGS